MQLYTQKFEECHAFTAVKEGGWSNHKADPGGKTMYGVTEVKFHEWLKKKGLVMRPVRSITKAEAMQLYFEEFWLKAGCEGLYPGVDLVTYDGSVNSGVSRGLKWLKAGLDKQNRHDQTVRNICRQRTGFVESLRTFKTFGRGWINRITDAEATGVARALKAMSANDNAVAVTLRKDETAATKVANRQRIGAAGSAGGAPTAGVELVTDPASVDQVMGLLLGGIVVVGVGLAAWLFFRSMVNASRAESYSTTAKQAELAEAA